MNPCVMELTRQTSGELMMIFDHFWHMFVLIVQSPHDFNVHGGHNTGN